MKNLKNVLKSVSEYQMLIQRLFLILSILILVLEIISKKSLIIWTACILIAAMAYALLSFCLVSEKQAFRQNKVLFKTIAICLGEVCNELVLSLNADANIKILVIVDAVLLLIGMIMSSRLFVYKTSYKDILTKNIYLVDGVFNEGDTCLGVDIETGKPNIIPYNDRFLHFLVLGVTGCGKTSQSLIPMVARDMDYKELGIVCLDPKGDFAETVCALAHEKGRGDEVVYFNPVLVDCPYFNPMIGDLDSVSENLVTTFKKLENETQTFFANMSEMLLRKCIKVSKWLYGDDANLNDINILMTNPSNLGVKMLEDCKKSDSVTRNPLVENEFSEIYAWFVNDYYTGLTSSRGTPTYQQSSGVRNQVAKLLSNRLIKKLLCPTKVVNGQTEKLTIAEMKEKDIPFIDFDKVLEEGGILSMSSAQGELRELGTFIGYFLILTFESSVFRRKGTTDDRKGVIFYVDEFQKYANDGYNDLLTQGRSYRVSSVLATQTRAGIAANSSGQEGKNLIETVSSNCRNKIIYPGCSKDDAEYYSKEFGDKKVTKERKGKSHAGGLLGGINPGSTNVSTNYEETYEPFFRPVDIQLRPFGEAVSQVVRYNTVQQPVAVKLNFIDKDLNERCKEYVAKYIKPREISYIREAENAEIKLNEKSDYTIEAPADVNDFSNLEDL